MWYVISTTHAQGCHMGYPRVFPTDKVQKVAFTCLCVWDILMDILCTICKGISHTHIGDIPTVPIRYPIGYPISGMGWDIPILFVGYPMYSDKISLGYHVHWKLRISLYILPRGYPIQNQGYPVWIEDIPEKMGISLWLTFQMRGKWWCRTHRHIWTDKQDRWGNLCNLDSKFFKLKNGWRVRWWLAHKKAWRSHFLTWVR